MTANEQREAARQFFYKWKGRGKEDEDARSYWIDVLQNIFAVDHVTDRVEFEKKVAGDKSSKRIDAYIPETHTLIEQKSLGIDLDKPQAGHDGKTPYEQAKEYDNLLPYNEKARWIIVSNFAEIWIYDMAVMKPQPVKIALSELPAKYTMLDFLVKKEVKKITEEVELSKAAGELVGKIRDRFLTQYNDPLAKRTQKSLNVLCVRLVFCFYAEDAGLFGEKDAFCKYLGQYEPKDMRTALIELFRVLDTPLDERADLYLSDELAAFPYVNGGLFSDENIVIPKITKEIKETLIESSHFDWSRISPTIFGAVFESTLNPETRRSGGMHYTSIENIHKVIDPLFLDDLKAELEEIKKVAVVKTRNKKLTAFQEKLSSLRFLDPAAGSGNFLTETYLSLRRLENEAIQIRLGGQMVLGEAINPVKVSIGQFYGIEINDFAVAVAQTALWIAESQMLQETESIVMMDLDFLPLSTKAHIVEGNALRIDWNNVIDKSELSYIMGNPPFVGMQWMSKEQKDDMTSLFFDNKKAGSLDYVSGWYKKAQDYIQQTNIKVAYVSTNSIVQGEQIGNLWKYLNNNGNIIIDFAYQTFIWNSEAQFKAAVHCVIIGFSSEDRSKVKRIFYNDGNVCECGHINFYLLPGKDIFIERRTKPICDVPKIHRGNQPTDGGNLILDPDEYKELISKEPEAIKYIKRFMMGYEFINNKERYCLWLVDAKPNDLKQLPMVMDRVQNVKTMREQSSFEQTRKMAETPTLMREQINPDRFIAIPVVSSERRRYVPMGYLDNSVIPGNKLFIIEDATLFHFGILESNVHMAWMRTVCGRLKSDYSYSKDIVYNNFPWPSPTEEQKQKIEQTAQEILDARAIYPDASLADLYDPLTMPPELKKAHDRNNAAVMRAYGMPIKEMDESACVAWLMRLYKAVSQNMTDFK